MTPQCGDRGLEPLDGRAMHASMRPNGDGEPALFAVWQVIDLTDEALAASHEFPSKDGGRELRSHGAVECRTDASPR
jgi:hypothetical protein